MFSSLRSRLWLSYSLLIGVVLLVMVITLGLIARNTPLLYRDTAQKLRLAAEATAPRFDLMQTLAPKRADKVLAREADRLQVRIVLLDAQNMVTYDSAQNKEPALQPPIPLANNEISDISRILTLRDSNHMVWLYDTIPIQNGSGQLLVLSKQPVLKLVAVMRDEVIGPLIAAGLLALFLAFLLSILMAGWVSAPLRKMTQAVHLVGHGEYPTFPEEGPQEVRDLARAFNNMTTQVKDSQQSQRDFLANVSHELKTPLTSIQGFAQAILDGAAATPEALQQAAQVIHSEAERMVRLVQDLMALARLEGGTTQLRREVVPLAPLLQNAVNRFMPQASQTQVALQLQNPPNVSVRGDADRLAQVLNNLLDNALKFTPPGGTILLSTAVQNKIVIIKVQDSGVGIAPEDQKRIFERFYQVDPSRKGGARRGVGLGLAIARQIVLAHGGSLTLQSEPGKGSLFLISLPLEKPAS